MILDAEEERQFTRAALDQMHTVCKSKALTEWVGPDGGDLVVDTIDGGKFWIQYDRQHSLYRCAAKSSGPAAPFEKGWRKAG